MRRLMEGLAFLVCAWATLACAAADVQETTGATAAVASQTAGTMPMPLPSRGYVAVPVSYDQPALPGYAWPTYASHPNYAGVTYPRHYSPSAWPYVGPHYPYPQTPLGWRNVTLVWDDGWWGLNFKAR